MHIVMLSESFLPHVGGVEKHLLHLCREMGTRGHAVTLLAPLDPPTLPRQERRGALRVLRFPRGHGPHGRDRTFWRWMLGRLPLLAGCDAVHVHGQRALLRWYLPFRFLLPWKPVFITFHGHPGSFPPGRRHRWERSLAERLVRDNLCVGHYLEKWYGTRAGAVTYGAAEPPGGPAPPVEDRAIAFVGRLEPDTGVLAYVEALRIVRETTGESWRLTLCGAGALRERIERLGREQALDLQCLGAVPDPLPWVRKSRFVFASGYLALLEAMACRRPALALYENPLKRDYLEMMPGAREMMVLAGSARELAASFVRLLDDPAREAALTERAARFAAQQTWERLARTYLDLYAAHGVH